MTALLARFRCAELICLLLACANAQDVVAKWDELCAAELDRSRTINLMIRRCVLHALHPS